MRKNPYDKILKKESKEQHINIVPKSYSYIYIYIYIVLVGFNLLNWEIL